MMIPVQVVRQPAPGDGNLVELTERLEAGWEAAARESSRANGSGTETETEALRQLRLVRLSPRESLLVLGFSPLCCDGSSLIRLGREIACLYSAAGKSGGTEEILQYADYSQWQNDGLEDPDGEEGREYWRQRRPEGIEPVLPFELRPAAKPSFDPDRCEIPFKAAWWEGIVGLARRHGVSEEAVLLAAWQSLLGRWTGSSDMLVAVAFDGRGYEELAGAFGLFVKYLPLAESVEGTRRFSDLLRTLHERLEEAALWQDFFSWEDPAPEESGAEPRVMSYGFELEDEPSDLGSGTMKVSIAAALSYAEPFKLRWVGRRRGDGAELRATLHFDRSRIAREDAERLAESFGTLVESLLADPRSRIGELEILGGTERRRCLEEWNRTVTFFPHESAVHQLFERQAAATPSAVALVAGDRSIPYDELDRWAERIAAGLVRHGVGPEVKVALYLPRSPRLIASVLGTWKAGGVYLILSPNQSVGRLETILDDARPSVILSEPAWVSSLPECPARVVDVTAWDDFGPSAPARSGRVAAEQLAYVVYTSGSTGRPKGVAVPHRGVVSYLTHVNRWVGLGVSDVVLQLTDPVYDASVRDTIGPLAAGARLVLLTEAQARDVEAILSLIRSHRATAVLSIVPTVLRALLAVAGKTTERWDTVRTLLISGEVLHRDDCEAARRVFRRDLRIVNLYGPTECTMTASSFEVPEDYRGPSELPIGRPTSNNEHYVLDPFSRPLPVGCAGQLHIGGVGLTRGYLGRPARTAESFIPHPFCDEPGRRLYRTGDLTVARGGGNLDFLGRIDRQLKHLGVRLEPGEIETRLRRHPQVRDAVVVAREKDGVPRLVAYVVSDDPIAAIPAAQRYKLPNGLIIRHLNRYETDFFYQQVFVDQVDVRQGLDLADGDVVFDVGANIGLFGLFVHLARRVRLFAFEPIPEIFEVMRTNLETYGADAAFHNCGLSDHNGEATFAYYPLSSCQSGYYPDESQERRMLEAIIAKQGGTPEALSVAGDYFARRVDERMQRQSVPCQLKTVSAVMADHGLDRVDLLKIDVEKSELDVLQGIRDEDWPKIRQISIEAHDLDGRMDAIATLLKKHDYQLEVGQEDALLEDTCLFNIYATRDARGGVSRSRRFELRSGGEVLGGLLSSEALREYLRGSLPEAMIPSTYVTLERLPLTASGKVDRAALPEPRDVASGEPTTENTRLTPTQEMVATVMASVLSRDEIDLDGDFFALGGHSLLGTQLILRLALAFEVEIPLQKLFEAPTVRELAAFVDETVQSAGAAGALPPIRPVSRHERLPLSFAQQRLWLIQQLDPANTSYHIRSAVHMEGRLDVAVMERAMTEIFRRHEGLRTTFSEDPEGPVQVIAPVFHAHLPVVDLSGLQETPRSVESQRLVERESLRPFDLRRDRLLRFVILRLAPRQHAAYMAVHHVVSDQWSMGVLVHEMTTLYNAFIRERPSPLPDLAIQYADFSSWQRNWLKGEELERHLTYWRKQLRGDLPKLDLPVRTPTPEVISSRGRDLDLELSPEVQSALRKLSAQEGTTLFMTLLAALKVLLHQYASQDEVVVGTDVANRTRTEIEPLIGFFVNVLVLRTNLGRNPTFRELLGRVRRVTLEGYAHQALPFEMVVEDIQPERVGGRISLFEVLFVLQNTRRSVFQTPDLTLKPIELRRQTANFDLLLVLSETEVGLSGIWNFRTDLLEEVTVKALSDRFERLLERIAANPDARLKELEQFDEDKSEQREMKKKRKNSKLEMFGKIQPQAVRISHVDLVKERLFNEGSEMPLVIEPGRKLDLVDWATSHREELEVRLLKHGAILFRGFDVGSVARFEKFAEILCGELFDGYGDLPRGEVAGKVYTTTPYPPEERILYHNESSQMHKWPLKQFFYCIQPSKEGGETPIVDTRKVYAALEPEIRDLFAEKGVMYTRTFIEGLDVSLSEFFGTTDRKEIEQVCREAQLDIAWLNASELQTRKIAPGVARHPKTREAVFFNQIQAHHISLLKPEVRESLLTMFGEGRLPRNVYFGDGSTIEGAMMQRILAVYEEHAVSFTWQPGDLLMVDNMLTAHSRNPYKGPRKIVVAMGEMQMAENFLD